MLWFPHSYYFAKCKFSEIEEREKQEMLEFSVVKTASSGNPAKLLDCPENTGRHIPMHNHKKKG